VPVKRARVGTAGKAQAGDIQVPFDVGWQSSSSDYRQAWTSCLDLLRHTQLSRFRSLQFAANLPCLLAR